MAAKDVRAICARNKSTVTDGVSLCGMIFDFNHTNKIKFKCYWSFIFCFVFYVVEWIALMWITGKQIASKMNENWLIFAQIYKFSWSLRICSAHNPGVIGGSPQRGKLVKSCLSNSLTNQSSEMIFVKSNKSWRKWT